MLEQDLVKSSNYALDIFINLNLIILTRLLFIFYITMS